MSAKCLDQQGRWRNKVDVYKRQDVVWLVFPAKTTFNDIISEEIEFITDNRRWENLKDMVKE